MPELGFILRRQASVVEYIKADPASGFMWGRDIGAALRFAREADAASVAALVADDCEVVAFDAALPVEPGGLLGGPISYGDAVALMTSRPGTGTRRPGFADFVVAYLGGRLMRVPATIRDGETSVMLEFVPTVEDEAAADWVVVP